MNELPTPCDFCLKENIVDLDNLERKKLDRVKTTLGFTCEHCGEWVPFFTMTSSLEQAFRKLDQKKPTSSGYHYRFAKAVKKAEGINNG